MAASTSMLESLTVGAAAGQRCAITASSRYSTYSRVALFPLERKFSELLSCTAHAPKISGFLANPSPVMAAVSIQRSVDHLSICPLSQKFTDLKNQGKVALIAYITAGDPDLETTLEALKVLDASGADIIEIGVPYSDPLADGPVIQAAATRALKRGATLESVLGLLKRVVPSLSCPIILFSYYNMILKRGPENFTRAIQEAGVSGIVVPDIPLEETHHLRQCTSANGIQLVLLTTPTTPSARMEVIARASEGFVYLVSLTGVTGARALVDSKVEDLVRELKKVTRTPVAVGFGISKPEHATQVARWGADGVIVGSAVVKILSEGPSPQDGIATMKRFISDLRAALDSLL